MVWTLVTGVEQSCCACVSSVRPSRLRRLFLVRRGQRRHALSGPAHPDGPATQVSPSGARPPSADAPVIQCCQFSVWLSPLL